MKDILKKLCELEQSKTPYVIATIISTAGSTPRKAGSKMVITVNKTYGTIGGGQIEYQVIEEAKKLLFSKEVTKLVNYKFLGNEQDNIDMFCGGEVSIFLEAYTSINLHIFGGGYVGQSIAKLGEFLGYNNFIYDDRDEFLNPNLFPPNTHLIKINDYNNLSELDFNFNDYIIIVTYMHKYDEVVLEKLYNKNAKYIGMIGSKTKVKKIRDNLISKGADLELLNKVYAPIGIDIGSQTPEEIAISIMAQIIKVQKE